MGSKSSVSLSLKGGGPALFGCPKPDDDSEVNEGGDDMMKDMFEVRKR